MLVVGVCCPHPPLLVPEVAAGAAGELDDLRAACDAAVAGLLEARPDTIVVVGAGAVTRRFGAAASGTLAGYGVPTRVGSRPPRLPLSLTLGRWLLDRQGAADRRVRFQSVAGDASRTRCLRLGERVAALGARVALLVMGDGTARRSPAAPGAFDERAAAFDEAVERALAAADPAALARLDPALAAELMVAGWAPWQVLAGATRAGAGGGGRAGTTPGRYRGRLRYAGAPYGVGYFVAEWVRRN